MPFPAGLTAQRATPGQNAFESAGDSRGVRHIAGSWPVFPGISSHYSLHAGPADALDAHVPSSSVLKKVALFREEGFAPRDVTASNVSLRPSRPPCQQFHLRWSPSTGFNGLLGPNAAQLPGETRQRSVCGQRVSNPGDDLSAFEQAHRPLAVRRIRCICVDRRRGRFGQAGRDCPQVVTPDLIRAERRLGLSHALMIPLQGARFTFPARGGVAPTREQLFAAGPHTRAPISHVWSTVGLLPSSPLRSRVLAVRMMLPFSGFLLTSAPATSDAPARTSWLSCRG